MQILITRPLYPFETIEGELFTCHSFRNFRSSLFYTSSMRSYYHNIGFSFHQFALVSTTFLLGSQQIRKASVLISLMSCFHSLCHLPAGPPVIVRAISSQFSNTNNFA